MVAVLPLLTVLATLLMACPTGSRASGGILCQDGVSIDAIVTVDDDRTYVFKGTHYWELTDEGGVASGYPRSITNDWDLPSNLDAAFTDAKGDTFFFKGGNYWLFSNMVSYSGYPRPISQDFPGIPNDIDAALMWSGNSKFYFFKQSLYWRFDPSDCPHVAEVYPAPIISNWRGIPNNIDGAFQYSNDRTYLFKEGQYWRYNDADDAVDSSYPLPTGEYWFGCS